METPPSTARNLGVHFFQCTRDRVSGAKHLPFLADLIQQRAATMDFGASWNKVDIHDFSVLEAAR